LGDVAPPARLVSPIEEPLEELEPVRLPPLPVLLDPPMLPEPPEPPDRLEPRLEEPLPVVLLKGLPPDPVAPVEPDVPRELDAGEAAEDVEPGGVVPDGSEPGVDEAFEDGFMGDVDM
jgi:hypothetical protein